MDTTTKAPAPYSARVPIDPVGLTEIAELLGRSLNTVKWWSSQGMLPEPVARIGGKVPVWSKREIEKWARKTGRLPADG